MERYYSALLFNISTYSNFKTFCSGECHVDIPLTLMAGPFPTLCSVEKLDLVSIEIGDGQSSVGLSVQDSNE